MAGKAANPKSKSRTGSMTDQMRAFACEYTVDFNGKAAAIRAGYSEGSAAVQASRLLAREDVQALIQERMTKLEKKTEINSERVLREAWGIATADVNDLVEFRRGCCRHCYGIDFGYQRTMQEMNRARKAYLEQKAKDIAKDPNCAPGYPDFDEQGGIGYDRRKPPVDDCQVCFGEGEGYAHFKDTRTLSAEARSLYAGVKQTKEGFQMLTIDKLGALEKLFKHLNLYKAEIRENVDALGEFLLAVQSRGGKLPIGGQPAQSAQSAQPEPAPKPGAKPKTSKWKVGD